jgi:hydroxyethylthiazole kinase-like uncharacterized protein yjeF
MATPHPDAAALRAALGAVSAAQVAELDAAAVRHGQAVAALMEVAGLQVARQAWHRGAGGRGTDVVAGHGNNGGDGLVAARYLTGWGVAVRALLIGDAQGRAALPLAQLSAARDAGVEIVEAPRGELRPRPGALVIDALLGSGLRGDPRESQARAIESIESYDVLAVDVPSGLDATSGRPGHPTVRARWTVTLAAMKAGLWTAEGRACAGDIVVADIGMPDAAWVACGLTAPSSVRGGGFWPVPSDTP